MQKKIKENVVDGCVFVPEVRGYLVDLGTGNTFSREFPTLRGLESACMKYGLGLSVDVKSRVAVAQVLPRPTAT